MPTPFDPQFRRHRRAHDSLALDVISVPAPGYGVGLPLHRGVFRALLMGALAGVLGATVSATWFLLYWQLEWGPVLAPGLAGLLVATCIWCVALCLGEELVRGYPAWGRLLVLVALAWPTLLVAEVGFFWTRYIYQARCAPEVALEHVFGVIRECGFGYLFSPRANLGYLVVFLVRTLGVPRAVQPSVVAALVTPIGCAFLYDPPQVVLEMTAISLGLLLGDAIEVRLLRRWRVRRRTRRAAGC